METLAGRNAVREALRARRRSFSQVLLARGVKETEIVQEILALCREAGVPVQRVPRQELDRVESDLVHQGIVAQVGDYPYVEVDVLLALARERGERPFLLALDSVQDPQNVGAILRTAEAVGVHGVIIPSRRAAQVTPAVSRASAGAVEHLYVASITNLVRVLDGLKDEGVWAVGVEQHRDSQDYRSVDLDMPLVLVLGGEGGGMRRLTAETCDLLVHLPMRGEINSLNVSVACSIMLYRAWEARSAA